MTDAPARFVHAELTERWRSLAARRKAYFVHLYDSGRWRLYYNQETFMAAMREVVAVAQAWEDLARRARSRVTPAIGKWPNGNRPAPAADMFNLSCMSRDPTD
jgi:uncharacterized repeat protein (TIGR03809 family)